MIAVIADDLTGAAELGGIGLRYGLQVEISTEAETQSNADLLVINLDSRSQSQQEAEKTVEKVCRQLAKLKPRFTFKKIDSVLRGHVLPEIKVQMERTGQQRALIVSANPALERTIVNGLFYYKGNLIHQSSFAHDPEFPITSSSIPAMLRGGKEEVHVLKHHEPLPQRGFIVGEVQTKADLAAWAKRLDDHTLAAGGSGFFEAILNEFNFSPASPETPAPPFQQPSLYVCGTTFQKTRDAIKKAKEMGRPVSYLPEDLVRKEQPLQELFDQWIKEIVSFLQERQEAIVAIDPTTTKGASALLLREHMAYAVAQVLQQTKVRELFLEGGSTAAAVLRKAGITKFCPVQQLAPGVIRMQAGGMKDLFFTLKPGSYDWPPDIPILHS